MPRVTRASGLLTCLVLLVALGGRPARAQAGPACFPETGFCVEHPAMLAYLDVHGGPTGLGFPISRLFRLRGESVQLFQRVALRLDSDGSPAPLRLLDTELLPLRRLDGSSLPSPEPDLLARRPGPEQPDFAARADAFLRETVPDRLGERPIGFSRLYRSVGGDDGPAGLDLFGWPTSGPTVAPEDPRLVFQRFEYAVFRYNPDLGQAQALLLGDYLKALLLGRGLSADLEADARGSPALRQVLPAAADGLQRPWELPDSDLRLAFRPDLGPEPRAPLEVGFGPETDWPAGDGAGGGAVGPVPGGYQIAVEQAGTADRGVTAAASSLRAYGDLTIVVDAQLDRAAAAGYALYLRQQANDDRLVLLIDAGRGLVSLYRRAGRRTGVLWDWTPVPALRPATVPNRLVVRQVGDRLALAINGSPVFDLQAGGPPTGTLWLAAVTWEQPVRALFSNLTLSEPE